MKISIDPDPRGKQNIPILHSEEKPRITESDFKKAMSFLNKIVLLPGERGGEYPTYAQLWAIREMDDVGLWGLIVLSKPNLSQRFDCNPDWKTNAVVSEKATLVCEVEYGTEYCRGFAAGFRKGKRELPAGVAERERLGWADGARAKTLMCGGPTTDDLMERAETLRYFK